LVEQTILDVGPHPDLLDARGMAMIAAGDFSAAIPHFTEAALAPSPARLLHLAHALCLVGDSATAAAQMQRATKLGLEPATLRPSDRQQMEVVLQRLGMQ
jgi:Flp pilus assembly protein TadD